MEGLGQAAQTGCRLFSGDTPKQPGHCDPRQPTLGDPQRSLPTSSILWFCDCVTCCTINHTSSFIMYSDQCPYPSLLGKTKYTTVKFTKIYFAFEELQYQTMTKIFLKLIHIFFSLDNFCVLSASCTFRHQSGFRTGSRSYFTLLCC